MNIYLVGFMGTGKTAVGRYLAQSLNLKFIDLDDLIEQKENRKIGEIFRLEGEDYFRQKESGIVFEISKEDNLVVAAGGGVIVNPKNLKRLKKTGVVICLSAAAEVIYERTKNETHRPLLKVDNPREKIKELLLSRDKFYRQAHFTVDTSFKSIKQISEEIISIFKNFKLQ